MSLMGIGTFFIGVIPGFASWGIIAPVVLILLRLIQGLALGGEYGGAAIYVAEHAPANKRGYYTSWIQTTATLGLFLALLLILGIRTSMGEAAFGDWGWRIPFLLSAILLAVSIWIRLKLNELPLFKRMVEEGKQSKRPLAEAFGQWSNAKIAILAPVWRHRRRGRGLVRRAVLRSVLPHPNAQGSRRHRADHDRDRARYRHAVLHSVRLAIRQDWTKADHARGFCAGGRDLLPDLPGHHPLRQSEA